MVVTVIHKLTITCARPASIVVAAKTLLTCESVSSFLLNEMGVYIQEMLEIERFITSCQNENFELYIFVSNKKIAVWDEFRG